MPRVCCYCTHMCLCKWDSVWPHFAVSVFYYKHEFITRLILINDFFMLGMQRGLCLYKRQAVAKKKKVLIRGERKINCVCIERWLGAQSWGAGVFSVGQEAFGLSAHHAVNKWEQNKLEIEECGADAIWKETCNQIPPRSSGFQHQNCSW